MDQCIERKFSKGLKENVDYNGAPFDLHSSQA